MTEICFNPYFVGCYSGSVKGGVRTLIFDVFQSLFCWMLFWKKDAESYTKWFETCFNPYFVGCYSGSSSTFGSIQ